jgi:hypothetical protein
MEHLYQNSFDLFDKETTESFIHFFDNSLVEINQILTQNDLESTDIRTISAEVTLFDKAKNSFSSLLSDYQKIIDEMFDNLLQEIKLYFQKINDKGYF